MGLAAVKGSKEHRLTEKISKTSDVKQTSPVRLSKIIKVISLHLLTSITFPPHFPHILISIPKTLLSRGL